MGFGREQQHFRLRFTVRFETSLQQQCELSRLRSSVALPLGINGDARHSKDGRGTFIGVLCGPKPAGFGVEAGSKRRCASLRGGRLRPARLFEPQEQSSFLLTIRSQPISVRRHPMRRTARLKEPQKLGPFLGTTTPHSPPPFCKVRPRRASPASLKASLRPRTAIPLGIALFALSSSGRSLRGPQQRQLRASAVRGFGPRDSASRKSIAQPTAQSTA